MAPILAAHFSLFVLLALLSWLGSAASEPLATPANEHQVPGATRRRHVSSAASGCDLLFADTRQAAATFGQPSGQSDKRSGRTLNRLASWCECKDSLASSVDDAGEETSPNEQALGSHSGDYYPDNKLAINHLVCSHTNPVDLQEELQVILQTNEPETQFWIDYLAVSVDWSARDRGPNRVMGAQQRAKRLNVDQLSFTWNTLASANSSSESMPDAQSATDQMDEFIGATLETSRLQSLAIIYTEQLLARASDDTVDVSKLLAPLSGLNRLELSYQALPAGGRKLKLLLNEQVLRSQIKLKWLNLASNSHVELGNEPKSIFGSLSNLDYLNLESSNLTRFPLFTLFDREFYCLNSEATDEYSTSLTFRGHLNLTSLNLAHNKLHSLMEAVFVSPQPSDKGVIKIASPSEVCRSLAAIRDGDQLNFALFKSDLSLAYEKHHQQQSVPFLLPSLNQLDVSYNRLKTLSIEESRALLCYTPNLAHLYLRNNHILGLNLNPLLSFDTSSKDFLLFEPRNSPSSSSSSRLAIINSKLDFIDLSNNRIRHLVAISDAQYLNATRVQLKSINLDNNKLKQPILLLNSSLINRVIFQETLDSTGANEASEFNLDNLQANFKLNTRNESICDYLSTPLFGGKREDGSLLNELTLNENRFESIENSYFASKQCRQIELLHLRANRIASIEPRSFDELVELKQLDLSENRLITIESNTNASLFSELAKLKSLDLSRNKINELQHKSTLESLVELEHLNLSKNELKFVHRDSFASNHLLARLDLSYNKLSHLDSAIFSHLKQLSQLNLCANNLRDYNAAELFRSMMTFTVFSFQTSGLKSGTEEKLPPFKSAAGRQNHRKEKAKKGVKKVGTHQALRRQHRSTTSHQAMEDILLEGHLSLMLSSNSLETFQAAESAQQCDSIMLWEAQYLALDRNQLREIHEHSFECFKKVQRLDLQSNQLKSFDMNAFKHMEQLEHLNVADNFLYRLRAFKAISQLPSLRHLDLSKNQLSQFDVKTLVGLPIEYLDLSDNPSLRLEAGELLSLLSSQQVPISQLKLNRISTIASNSAVQSNGTNSGSRHMIAFELDSISREISANFFQQLSQMNLTFERLKLANLPPSLMNNSRMGDFLLKQMSHKSAKNNEQHQVRMELDLSSNNITNEQFVTILGNNSNYENVIELNLGSNRMESWPNFVNFSQLKSVDLSTNKLKYFIHGNSINRDYNLQQLECLNLSSNALIGLVEYSNNLGEYIEQLSNQIAKLMPKLKQIDLSYNRLTWLPAQLFKNLKLLEFVRLHHNPLESVSALYINEKLFFDLSYSSRLKSVELLCDHCVENQENIFYNERLDSELECNPFEADYLTSPVLYRNSNEITTCESLLSTIPYLSLDFISRRFNWTSLNGIKTNIRLSLTHNDLKDISGLIEANLNKVLQLNISHNNLRTITNEEKFCEIFRLLSSLNLSHNQLWKFPWILATKCEKMSHLDLSYNQIETIDLPQNYANLKQGIQLLTLRLNNNLLKQISADLISRYLPNLSLLDLRNNPKQTQANLSLQELKFFNPKLELYLDQSIQMGQNYQLERIELASTNNVLVVNASKRLYSIKISRRREESEEEFEPLKLDKAAMHVIRYCAIAERHSRTWNICLAVEQSSLSHQRSKCFLLRPPDGPGCMTDLTGLEQASNSSSIVLERNNDFLIHPPASQTGEQQQQSGKQTDLVLLLIDRLKSTWLWIREFNLGKQISSISRIEEDSVLFSIHTGGSEEPIRMYTLSALKLAICLASVCIILLLLAMFSLLFSAARRVGIQRRRRRKVSQAMDRGRDESASEDTNKTFDTSRTTDHHHSSGSQSNGSQTTTATNCSSASKQLSSDVSATSTTSATSQQSSTVIERQPVQGVGIIGNGQHYHNHERLLADVTQLAAQNCLTPSSSLAPSSVETAETMQAVDSIQSSSTTTTLQKPAGFVDQYSLMTGLEEAVNCEALRGPPVATVLRMVKSSSANAFQGQQHQHQHYQHQQAGTLMRNSRMQTIHERSRWQQQQYYTPHLFSGEKDSRSSTLRPAAGRSLGEQASEQMHDLDPTTLSLLSINTALSSALSSQQGDAQVSPSSHQQHYQYGPIGGDLNLCHYHQAAFQQQAHKYLIVQQQQQQQQPTNGDYSSHPFQSIPSPPPPPPAID